ncbi:hypothetical protein [Streptomyces sp. NPDC001435]|uniref:hypothetical protein n=1 Tax=unclassified Streptomyces TaxID=2593676 RepID=UPI0036891B0D
MKRSSGVRLCATAAVSVLSLALITGCSDGGSKDSGGSGSAKGSDSAAKALSAAELKKLILAQGEVDGYKVTPAKTDTVRDTAKSDNATCEPLLDSLSGRGPGDAVTQTGRTVMEDKKDPTDDATSMDDMADGKFEDAINKSLDRDVTILGLASYDGDGAEKALQSVSDAVKGCSGGFTATVGSDKQKYTKIAEEKSSGTGDESVAFAATADMEDGDAAPVHVEVVRHKNNLVTYYTMNIGAMMSKKAYTVPPAVTKAQAAKLK